MEGRRSYRNTDWWSNSTSKEVENGIFVPIYNYRFVDPSTKDEVLQLRTLKDALSQLKEMNVKVPRVYGVRVKDIKKAEELGLESISTFYKREAKKLLNNKEILVKVANYKELDAHFSGTWYNLETHQTGGFFSYCKKNNLSKDSLMYKFLELNSMKGKIEEEVRPYNRLISHLSHFDKQYEVSSEKPSFDYSLTRKLIYKTYPMIQHLTFSDWGDHKEDKVNGLEYVKQMDNLMELEQSKNMEKVA
jgi:hypothetical protein